MTASVPITTSGFVCSICGQVVPNGVTHVCAGSPPLSNLPLTPQYGVFMFRYPWTCSVCGKGCAPWMDTCPGPHSNVSSVLVSGSGTGATP